MFKIIFIFLLVFLCINFSLRAEQTENVKSELGFWLGAANPLPGSETSRLLNTTLGLGGFGRIQWPYSLYIEGGFAMANYLSKTERSLTVVPVHAALCYKLPFELPVSIFIKGGGGAAFVVARPSNTAKWDRMGIIGTEISFVAGKKVRIGLRMDFFKVFETVYNDVPIETQRLYLSPYDRDYRLYNPNYYKLKDAEFFNFALMVSFLL